MRVCGLWGGGRDDEEEEAKGAAMDIRSSREAKLALGVWQTVAMLFSVQEIRRTGCQQAAQGRGSPQFQCTVSGDPSFPFLAPGLPVPFCLVIL